MSVTMRDIARRLSISHTTVSRALNNDSRISEKTRRKVTETAEAMGYRMNVTARALASGRTGSIALVVPYVSDPFFAGVIGGVERITSAHGYNIKLYITRADARRERSALSEAGERRYDGMILFRRHANLQDLDEFSQHRLPIVMLTRHESSVPVDYVYVDDIDGGYKAASFLADLGHRKIGFIGGPIDEFETKDRFDGFLRALKERDLEFDSNFLWFGHFDEIDGRRVAESIVKRSAKDRPTAVFAANDRMAIGLLERLKELGFRIPEDFSIIGYDDIEPSRYVSPKLTTVRQPTTEMGERAADLLVRRLMNETFPAQEVVFQTEIVVRGTCSRPRSGD